MKLKIKQIAKWIMVFMLVATPLAAFAQVGSSDGVSGGLSRISSHFPNTGNLNRPDASVTDVLLWVIDILLILSGIIAVLFIIIGGFWYITSAGDSEQAEKGKTTLVNAIIGIVVVVLSFVIITVITNLVGNNNV